MSHGLYTRYFVLWVILLISQSCQLSQDVARRQEAAARHVQLGLAYLERGDKVRAKQKLVLALKEAPDSASVNASMAYLMEQIGDEQQAGKLYRQALQYAPRHGGHLNNYAVFLCHRGQYHQAAHYFALAMEDKYYDHAALVYENAGLCALAEGNRHQAQTYFQQALRHDPSRQVASLELKRMRVI